MKIVYNGIDYKQLPYYPSGTADISNNRRFQLQT